jgi:hypothetical protein
MVPPASAPARLHLRPLAASRSPDRPLAGSCNSSAGTIRSLAAPCVFNTSCVYLCVSARCSHPPADSPPSLLSARSLCNVFGLRRKWEQSFSVGCTEPVRCPGTCKLRVVAHPPTGQTEGLKVGCGMGGWRDGWAVCEVWADR